jgi:PleD family two-component response regulator
VNEPLALLLCSRRLIAIQLTERLEALRYRIVVLDEPAQLRTQAEADKAMVVFADMEGRDEALIAAVKQLRSNASTSHIPVIGFRRELDDAAQSALTAQGFATVVNETAILSHLTQLLDRALDIR